MEQDYTEIHQILSVYQVAHHPIHMQILLQDYALIHAQSTHMAIVELIFVFQYVLINQCNFLQEVTVSQIVPFRNLKIILQNHVFQLVHQEHILILVHHLALCNALQTLCEF